MNIILIDDDEDTNFLMTILMKKSKVINEYFIESNATKAIELLENGKVTPDCIFVDLQMPNISGFEFVEIYEKSLADKFPQTQLYILSSSAIPEDYEQAMKFKTIKGFITKPLTPNKLEKINAAIAASKPTVELSSPVCFVVSKELRQEYKIPPQKP